MIKDIHKKIVVDENNRPLEIIIGYDSTFAPRVITAFADSKREMQPYYFEG